MRLTDIMSHSGLVSFAEIALVLALIAFAVIVFLTFRRRNRAEHERARYLPLESDPERAHDDEERAR
jgi:cbb3-type cytochrome oxidase subunit 3